MLRNFAAALVATTLLGGPALAQTTDTSKPAAQSQTASAASTAPAKAGKTVKHAKTQTKHLSARHRVSHQARHAKPVKTHQAGTDKSGHRS